MRKRFTEIESGCRAGARTWVLLMGSLSIAALTGCHATTARAQTAESGAVGVNAVSAEFPGEDGVIVRWEQSWTIEKDGTVHRRDHQLFKYLSRRPIRALADPRLDYNDAQDELIIHTARTHLPDGTVLDVPDYSFNLAGPDDVTGWPAYGDWQQMVVSFSGIETYCVTELDYEVVTKPGVLPWIDADLRLHEDYPTLERVIRLTLPTGAPEPQFKVENMFAGDVFTSVSIPDADGLSTYTWNFEKLAGARDEPQSLPWQQRCGRFRFTTGPNATEWVATMVKAAERAAQPSAAVERFAEAAVEKESDPLERVRRIAAKIRDSFNFIDSFKARRELNCRSAVEVLRSNYGNGLESAALCAAAVRSLGMRASLAVAVDATIWNPQVPTVSALAGMVVAVDLDGETLYIHPEQGVIRNPGSWGKHRLLSVAADGKLQETYVQARGENAPSELHVTGKIAIDKDAKATGELRIRLTGSYYDPAALETAGAQESLVKGMVGRLLSDVAVDSHSIVALSDEVLRATANLATSDALPEFGTEHVLRLGDGPAFLGNFPLPLDRSYRNTAVDLHGAFKESVDLTIELPEKWRASITPATMPTVKGDWGSLSQEVEIDGRTIRFRRAISITSDRIEPGEFTQLREAVNRLRSAQSLLLTLSEG